MFISKVPLRVSFLGGGSDLPEFYNKGVNGEVLGLAINKHICIYANQPEIIDSNLIKYSITESFENPEQIKHPLFREILKEHWDFSSKIELASFADIRSGTGLGSSSAFAIALISLLLRLKNQTFTPYSLCKEGFKIEREILKDKVGLQDGAFAAYGGCCHFEFSKGNKIDHKTVNISEDILNTIKDSMFLIYTDESRQASKYLNTHTNNLASLEDKYSTQSKIMSFVKPGKKALEDGDLKTLASMIRESYELKKTLNGDNKYLPEKVKSIEEIFDNPCVWGYKLLGAGGGGFFLIMGEPKFLKDYLLKSGLKPITVKTDFKGCRVFSFDSESL